ncbi:hypothetical protein HaLaN_23973 [Haematococcus lacustris]|uniref:Pherophorin domain-containing protein n=1 Tax=Haematococcus lacustris TaxID=44745 RepID=A0A6A0A4M2_HAELA|nr:hypothetical protein HaLaN_23973 [Haematococcus lacustris]
MSATMMGASFLFGVLLVASLAASASAAFPWCTCSDYAIGSSPYSLSLFSTTTSATNITATFVVNALDTPARPSTCFNILQDNGVEKIELASSISCLRNKLKAQGMTMERLETLNDVELRKAGIVVKSQRDKILANIFSC